MSGEKINNYGSTNTNLDSIMETIDADRMAKIDSISLTNMSTTGIPAIEAASVVEIANSVYRFSTEEPISTSNIASTATMTYYVELVPSSSQVSAQFSSDTPAWRSDYQGFYTSTTSANRNIARTDFDGTNYNDKAILRWNTRIYVEEAYINSSLNVEGNVTGGGTITTDSHIYSGGNMYSTGNVYVTGDVYSSGNIYAVADISATDDLIAGDNVIAGGYLSASEGIREAGHLHGSHTNDEIYSALSALIPSTGDKMIVRGGVAIGATALIIAYCHRETSTLLRFYGIRSDGNPDTDNVISGSTVAEDISITW